MILFGPIPNIKNFDLFPETLPLPKFDCLPNLN